MAGGDLVGDEPAGSGDDDEIVEHQYTPTNNASHCSETAATPGHNRSGLFIIYSDPSACTTSTREARAAGISDATTAALMSTAAAPSTGRAPGSCM